MISRTLQELRVTKCHPVSPDTRVRQRQRFVLQVEGDADRHTIHSLRAILKALTRRYGLRCTEVREVRQDTE
jgi:hypothetical protein